MKVALVLLIVLFGGVVAIAACEGRDTNTTEKALAGHWSIKNTVRDIYFAPDGDFTIVGPDEAFSGEWSLSSPEANQLAAALLDYDDPALPDLRVDLDFNRDYTSIQVSSSETRSLGLQPAVWEYVDGRTQPAHK